MKVLTDDEIAEIEARANAATPLPDDGSIVRTIYDHGGGRMYIQRDAGRDLVLDSYNRGDSEFYFHAREDIPALCATVRALRAENARVYTPSIVEALRLLDDAGYGKEVPNSLSEMIKKVLTERDDLLNRSRQTEIEIVRVEQRTERDCLRCCIAMVTRIDYDDVPDFVADHGESWPTACEAWLSGLGMGLLMMPTAPTYVPPWLPIIARGSTGYSDVHHFVVVTPNAVIDPSPSQHRLKEAAATYAVINSGTLANEFIGHLAAKYSTACSALSARDAENTALREQLAEMQIALQPFAALDVEAFSHLRDQSDDREIYKMNDTVITVGDVRKARALLAREQP